MTGSFAAFDPDIRIDVRVVRISSGDIVAANMVGGKKNAFFLLQEALSNAIAANLVQVLGKKNRAIATTRHTNSIANARAYGTTLDAKDKGDLEAASDALAPVVSSDARA